MTVATFAAGAALRSGGFAVLARIEGLGTFDGLYTWCSTPPLYAAADPLFLATIKRFPQGRAERVPREGGLPELSAVDLELVDHRLAISRALRPDQSPFSFLDSACTASSTSVVVQDEGDLPATDGLVYVDGEAITFTGRSGSAPTTLTGCSRAALGTTARSHTADAPVFTASPFLRGRSLSLYLVPIEASTADAELLIGEYAVRDCELLDTHSTWRIGGPSRSILLARKLLAAGAPPFRIDAVTNGGKVLRLSPERALGVTGATVSGLRTWSSSDLVAHLRLESGEIVRCTASGTRQVTIDRRGALDTEIDEIKTGSVCFQVATSDPDYGEVRLSPGPNPSESRSSGTWNRTANWVDQLLAAFTSSANTDDGLELVNHRGTGGLYSDAGLSDEARSNWSSLQVGIGLGIRATRLELESFVAVRARTPHVTFPTVVLGDEPLSFATHAAQFLGCLGAFFVTVGDQIGLALPRQPLTGETLPELTPSNILEVLSVRYDQSVPGSVLFNLGEGEVTVQSSAVGLPADEQEDANSINVDAPSLRGSWVNTFLLSTAANLLSVASRPHWRIRLRIDGSMWALSPSALVRVTHPDLPNLASGERGWTDVVCQTLERKGPTETLTSEIELVAYPTSGVAARVAQAAIVSSSTTSGGNRVVTVAVNRYTSPDADLLELPVSDETQFEVGDFVHEMTRAGAFVGSAREVLALGSGTVTIAGTTAPTNGNVLVTADYGDQEADQQQAVYASQAAMATLSIDSSAAAHRYAGR